MTFPHIRAPWLRYFAERRHRERRRTMAEVYQGWLAGIDLELSLPLPHYADVLGVANDNWESER